MSRIQAAHPYAKAVFELAQNQSTFDAWSSMLQHAAYVAQDKGVVELIKNPQCAMRQVIDLFLAVGKGVYSQEMQNFIQVLAQAGRLMLLPEVYTLYEHMRTKAQKVEEVELISAQPMSEAMQASFKEALGRRMRCDIVLHCKTDEQLLGGAVIRVGDRVIDGSLRGRLSKLCDAIGIS